MSSPHDNAKFLITWLRRLMICGVAIIVLHLLFTATVYWFPMSLYEIALAGHLLHTIAYIGASLAIAVVAMRFRAALSRLTLIAAAIGVAAMPLYPDGFLGFHVLLFFHARTDEPVISIPLATLWVGAMVIGIVGFAVVAQRIRAHFIGEQTPRGLVVRYGLPGCWFAAVLLWLPVVVLGVALSLAYEEPRVGLYDADGFASGLIETMELMDRIDRLHFLRGRAESLAVLAMSAAGVWTLLLIWRIRKRLQRWQKGLCPCCQYDLRANPMRCSECGWTLPSRPNERRP